MRKKILFTAILILQFTFPVLKCQEISRDVLDKFNPSIISRIYKITSQLNLSNEEQLQLAKAFEVNDSIIAAIVKDKQTFTDLEYTESFALVALYDSLITENNLKAKSVSFINEKIEYLDQIKPLSQSQKQKLAKLFLDKCKDNRLSYGDALRLVLPKIVNDTIYYARLYAPEIKLQMLAEVNAYPLKNDFPFEALRTLRPILQKYIHQLVTVDYASPGADRDKIALVKSINEHYMPIIDSLKVRYGFFKPVTLFTSAVRLRKTLKLDENQIDKLLVKAAELEKIKTDYTMKNPDDVYNSADYSHKNLSSILTEEQYRTLLQLRFQKKAEANCVQSWHEIKQYGVTTQADSVQVNNSLYFYHLDKFVINTLYQDKPEMKTEKLRQNEFFRPEIIKALDLARKEAKEKGSAKNMNKNNFVW
ncbi:hypothetical protein D0T53_03460 [Dysgonomonas sp. 216]|uniref:hypothetical protein n=1 Tax=Dysgonomonas sp. 216 TaxID=2302934 RepID=UPI0013D3E82C|nr:hypothetical protein [Dysgonomonas sp. 216]NDW17974.1 hypothetical protein [Dysgonomonas sp. 216]